MESPKLTISLGGHRFLFLWSIALLLLFVAMGVFAVTTVTRFKLSADLRQRARMDPHAVEAGRTSIETALPAGANPRKVSVGIYVDGVADISIVDASWSPVFYLWFRWTGDDINPGESFTIFEGEILSKQKLNDEVIDGEHWVVYLVRARISKFFDSSRFPVDNHLLTIAIEDGELGWTELAYVPDLANSDISSRVRMPGYVVKGTEMIVKPHTYRTTFGDPRLASGERDTYSQMVYGIANARAGFGPYSKTFLALFAAVAIAMLACFIKPTDVDPRFGLGVGGFFGAVANQIVSSAMVPDGGIMTLLDIVNGIGIITIFLILVQSTISLYLYDIREELTLSRRFDRLSLAIFVIGFLIINLWIPHAAIVR